MTPKALSRLFKKTTYYSKDFSKSETRFNFLGKPKWYIENLLTKENK